MNNENAAKAEKSPFGICGPALVLSKRNLLLWQDCLHVRYNQIGMKYGVGLRVENMPEWKRPKCNDCFAKAVAGCRV